MCCIHCSIVLYQLNVQHYTVQAMLYMQAAVFSNLSFVWCFLNHISGAFEACGTELDVIGSSGLLLGRDNVQYCVYDAVPCVCACMSLQTAQYCMYCTMSAHQLYCCTVMLTLQYMQ